jgi:hypothetical protein
MPSGPIKKEVYKNQKVKDAIDSMNDQKCGFCGVTLSLDIQRNVEHYRPGKAVIYSSTVKFNTGYYWLTANWDNLLPSCNPCNSIEGREFFHFIDGRRMKKKNLGKGNHFPLETMPNQAPDHSLSIVNEVPLIFNPFSNDPNSVFEYVEYVSGALPIVLIRPKDNLSYLDSKIALTSIDILGLNRILLCTERAKVWNVVDTNIVLTKSAMSANDSKLITDLLRRLLSYIDPTIPTSNFIGMIWRVFYEDLKSVAAEINRIENSYLSAVNAGEILIILRSYRDKYSQNRQQITSEVYASKGRTLNLNR